jgi:hypothetical protein
MRRLRRSSVATLQVLTRVCRSRYRADRGEGLGVVFWGTRKKDSKREPRVFIDAKFSSACCCIFRVGQEMKVPIGKVALSRGTELGRLTGEKILGLHWKLGTWPVTALIEPYPRNPVILMVRWSSATNCKKPFLRIRDRRGSPLSESLMQGGECFEISRIGVRGATHESQLRTEPVSPVQSVSPSNLNR